MQQSRYNYTNMTRDSGSALTCFEAANSSAANSNIKASMHVCHTTIHHSVPDIRFFMGLVPNKLDHWGFCWLQPCFPLGQVQPNGEKAVAGRNFLLRRPECPVVAEKRANFRDMDGEASLSSRLFGPTIALCAHKAHWLYDRAAMR